MMNRAELVLLLGSNAGDRKAVLEQAITEIEAKLGSVLSRSSLYETKAWGFDGDDFLNQVIIVSSSFSALECLEKTQSIEKQLGRHKKSQKGIYENRLIDIDILFLGEQILELEYLSIPHPRIAERRFTLAPLEELIPDFVHPKLNKKVRELLIDCEDQTEVKKLNG
jgi:2-amino-4-hydroxy-6-hydroxymethyldihydropteridine diphosphokinase